MTGQPDRPLVGSVEILGLRCSGRHGAYSGEQDAARPFLVDVQVRIDIRSAAATDSLDQALDIADLAAAVREVLAGPPRALLERVALDVARTVLDRFTSVEQARVRVAKPEPPGLDAAQEAVEVTLARG